MKKSFKYILSCVLILDTCCSFAQSAKIDSLLSILKTAKEDSTKIKTLNDLAWKFQNSNPDSSILLSEQALEKISLQFSVPSSSLFEKLKNIDYKTLNAEQYRLVLVAGKCFHQLGGCYLVKSNYPRSLDFYFKALSIWDELEKWEYEKKGVKDPKSKILGYKSKTLGYMGIVYDEQGDYPKALDYYFKALKMDEMVGRKTGIAAKSCNIGLVYKEEGDAIQNIIENHYQKDSLYQKALDYYFKSLKINEELNSKGNIATCLGNIGVVYDEQKKHTEALGYYLKALKIDEEIGDKNGMAVWIQDIGSLYTSLKKYSEAEKYLKNALLLNKKIGAIDYEMKTENDLSELYTKTNRYQLALEHYKKAMSLKDTLFSADKNKEITRKEMNYEFEKKEAKVKAENEKQQAVAEADKKKQQVILYSVIGGLLVVLIFAIFIFRALRITRRQKTLIEKQKKLVEEKQKEILDSIHYAKRIQTALLPTEKYITKSLKRLMKYN